MPVWGQNIHVNEKINHLLTGTCVVDSRQVFRLGFGAGLGNVSDINRTFGEQCIDTNASVVDKLVYLPLTLCLFRELTKAVNHL